MASIFKRSSIFKRPLDLFIVVALLFFLLIAVTIDFTQAFYGRFLTMKDSNQLMWPPPKVLEMYAWWCENYDPLLRKNPLWFETMSWFSAVLYAPFYCCAIYAFICGKNWIRIPALMWGYGLLLTMFVVVRAELYGEYAAPDVTMFLMAYGAYVAVPILVMLRVANYPVFTSKQKSSKHKSS